jgi:hypothetical protein
MRKRWWKCGRLGQEEAALGPMLERLGMLRLGWWKCGADADMLGRAVDGLVEM